MVDHQMIYFINRYPLHMGYQKTSPSISGAPFSVSPPSSPYGTTLWGASPTGPRGSSDDPQALHDFLRVRSFAHKGLGYHYSMAVDRGGPYPFYIRDHQMILPYRMTLPSVNTYYTHSTFPIPIWTQTP